VEAGVVNTTWFCYDNETYFKVTRYSDIWGRILGAESCEYAINDIDNETSVRRSSRIVKSQFSSISNGSRFKS
jgi:hypothetical protein